MKQYFYLFLSLIFLTNGCSREKNIEGEIFIVTQGGQNLKLGLVTVGLISREAFTRHLDSKIKIASEIIQPIYTSYKQLEDSISLLGKLNDELEQKKNSLEIYNNDDKMLALLKKKLWVARKNLDLTIRIAPLQQIYRTYTSGAFFLNESPPFSDSTKTNSDGQFNFMVQKSEKYFIIASAARLVGNSSECYYWVVDYPNPSFRKNEKILLGNDNLFDPLKLLNLENSQTQKSSKI